jgi:hypothetical protein
MCRAVKKKSRALFAALILSLFATPGIAQQNLHPQFQRIYDGDYVWSVDFPKRETSLLAYGWGLYNAVREQCPGIISQSSEAEVDAAFDHMTGQNQYGVPVSAVLIRATRLGSQYLALQTAAANDAKRLADKNCSGRIISRAADNVWRMLATKRPAHQAEGVSNSTLIKEITLPIETYHYYSGVGVSLVGGAARRVFDRDVEEVKAYGMTILECHYDNDPEDQYHEEQYYWGPSVGARIFSQIPIVWQNFLLSSQARMDKAMGTSPGSRYAAIHPFTTYGAPRGECPAIADTAMHVARIENPEFIRWPEGKCKRLDNGLLDCP